MPPCSPAPRPPWAPAWRRPLAGRCACCRPTPTSVAQEQGGSKKAWVCGGEGARLPIPKSGGASERPGWEQGDGSPPGARTPAQLDTQTPCETQETKCCLGGDSEAEGVLGKDSRAAGAARAPHCGPRGQGPGTHEPPPPAGRRNRNPFIDVFSTHSSRAAPHRHAERSTGYTPLRYGRQLQRSLDSKSRRWRSEPSASAVHGLGVCGWGASRTGLCRHPCRGRHASAFCAGRRPRSASDARGGRGAGSWWQFCGPCAPQHSIPSLQVGAARPPLSRPRCRASLAPGFGIGNGGPRRTQGSLAPAVKVLCAPLGGWPLSEIALTAKVLRASRS